MRATRWGQGWGQGGSGLLSHWMGWEGWAGNDGLGMMGSVSRALWVVVRVTLASHRLLWMGETGVCWQGRGPEARAGVTQSGSRPGITV